MNVNFKLEILRKLQREDKKFSKKCWEEHGAATICVECGKNTHVGLYPFWHIFGRNLCSVCGEEYTRFLRNLGCLDD